MRFTSAPSPRLSRRLAGWHAERRVHWTWFRLFLLRLPLLTIALLFAVCHHRPPFRLNNHFLFAAALPLCRRTFGPHSSSSSINLMPAVSRARRMLCNVEILKSAPSSKPVTDWADTPAFSASVSRDQQGRRSVEQTGTMGRACICGPSDPIACGPTTLSRIAPRMDSR